MLNSKQFAVLRCCMEFALAAPVGGGTAADDAANANAGATAADATNATAEPLTQREIVKAANMSLGSVNTVIRELQEMGFITEDYRITPEGVAALEPYKVTNAVIMAAGLSSRFAPISYEKPKGVLRVLGEVMIERQIRQLQEAGITDITVVVGYKKEEFFYLEDELGVKIVVNPDYAVRNNNSTIKRIEGILDNTYICSSDDYFTENPFEPYVYTSYYSAVFDEGETEEYCLTTKGREHLITGATVGGRDSWVMLGHVYWSREFSKKFVEILDEVYDEPETAGKLWEDIYLDHIDELPMVMRKYPHGVIWEFDNLDELNAFDPNFIDNVDSSIMDNICSVFECTRADITGIVPIKQGLTNLSFSFDVAGKRYVYRHPGDGTDAIINRASETASQKIGHSLGLDDTFIFEDGEKGWKISSFVENCTTLDYHNWNQVETAIGMARKLHSAEVDTGFEYDVYKNALEIVEMLDAKHRTSFRDFDELLELVKTLYGKANANGARRCLCHCDFYDPNFLVTSDTDIQLIDWEYSGMSDYAVDLGVFICCCPDYTLGDAARVLDIYFEGEPSDVDRFHCYAYTALASFYWFVWALYKDACGDPVGEYLYLWYKYTKSFGRVAMQAAERIGL